MEDANTINPVISSELPGKGVLAGMLLDPLAETKDLALARRAIKERWKIPEDRKEALVSRLFDIVDKTSVTIVTKNGTESVDDKADTNAVAAARVIVAMEGQNQAEEKPAQSNTTNVSIGIGVRVVAGDGAMPL